MTKRLITTITLLWLWIGTIHIFAQSQYEVWFDLDHDRRITGEMTTDYSTSMTLPLNDLSQGLHCLNFRTFDDDGNYGVLHRKLFVYMPELSVKTSEMVACESWFDNDYASRMTEEAGDYKVTFVKDLSHLKPGVHVFNFRAIGEGGAYGPVMRKMFAYAPELSIPTAKMTGYEVWIDRNYDSRICADAAGTEILLEYDLSALPVGLHTFNFRAIGQGGNYGPVMRKMIYVAPEDWVYARVCEYSIDGEEPVSVDICGDALDLSIDISKLVTGDHTFSVRTMGSNGKWGPVYTRTFSVTGVPLAAEEWTLLYALRQELQTMGWTPDWDFGKGMTTASGFDGIEIIDGHIIGFNFKAKGLTSTPASVIPLSVFSFPYLQRLDLTGNNLSGDVDKTMAALALTGKAPGLGTLLELNISNNRLSGNLGVVGSRKVLPSLNSLDASHNCFADVFPAVPSGVSFNYSHQHIDRTMDVNIADLRDLDIEQLYGLDYTSAEAQILLSKLPPTITFYNHKLQTWMPPTAIVMTAVNPDDVDMVEDIEEWALAIGWNEFGLNFPFVSEDFYIYRGQSGDILNALVADYLSDSGNDADDLSKKLLNIGTDFKIRFSFADGDVNFDGDVNVIDLQSIINFIFEIYNMNNVKPFNFTSANRQNLDERIDVRDAVLMVTLLLDKKVSPSTRSADDIELARNIDGYLWISSAEPVAAFELTIAGDDEISIERAIRQYGLSCELSKKDGYTRVVAYSMEGNTLPEGNTRLGWIGNNFVTEAVLSNAYAERISEVAGSSKVNTLEDEDSNVAVTYGDGVLTIDSAMDLTNVRWTIYSADGMVFDRGIAESLAAGTNLIRCGRMSDGVAIIVVDADQNVHTQSKIMIQTR